MPAGRAQLGGYGRIELLEAGGVGQHSETPAVHLRSVPGLEQQQCDTAWLSLQEHRDMLAHLWIQKVSLKAPGFHRCVYNPVAFAGSSHCLLGHNPSYRVSC